MKIYPTAPGFSHGSNNARQTRYNRRSRSEHPSITSIKLIIIESII
nr:hypothetical protein [Staphylococcus epidermidis]